MDDVTRVFVIIGYLIGAGLLLTIAIAMIRWLFDMAQRREDRIRERSAKRVLKRIRQLGSRRHAVRQRAASILFDHDLYKYPWQSFITGAGLAPERLLPLLTDRDCNARWVAGQVAKELGWKPVEMKHLVLLGLAQGDLDAIRGAGNGYREYLISLATSDNLSLGINIAEAMGNLRDPIFIEPLYRILEIQGQGEAKGFREHEIYRWIRGKAAYALGEIGDSRCEAKLLEALSSGVERASTALAKISGARAIDPILQYMFNNTEQTYHYYSKGEDWSLLALESSAKHSAVTDAHLLHVAACCRLPVIEEKTYSDVYGDRTLEHVDLDRSLQAVKALCADTSAVASNVLHLIVSRPAIKLVTYPHKVDKYGHSPLSEGEATYGFETEKKLAQSELARRGNPKYDVSNYLSQIV